MIALPGGFRPKKRLDQYFLLDKEILHRETYLASLTPKDVVLEIGAGNGALTELIARKAGRVIAVEKDPRLAVPLANACPDNVEVIEGDALELEFPSFDKVMGNLPYSISTPLLFKILEHDFILGVLGLQYEFAQRMVAAPGTKDYSRLSVMVALRTRMSCLSMRVPRSAFWPVPDVDSAIVKLAPGVPEGLDEPSAEIIKMIFCHRRKTLANAIRDSDDELIRLLGITSTDVLKGIQTDWKRRVFQMEPLEMLHLAKSIGELAKDKEKGTG